jgi:ABC-type sugar transport system, ATPase component
MSASMPVFVMQEVSKAFGGVQALQNVHCEIYSGEVHAILGENGAGKSTLIKIMTGVYQPDSGSMQLEGRPVVFNNTREAQEHGIVAIYQEPSLFPDLDIAENIFVGRQPVRWGIVDWQRMYADAQALLERLGLKLDPRTKARELSVAQQQIVEIARALSMQAKVLIMDEPTSSLTLGEVEDLFAIVRQLRAAGTAIVFISHRLEELFTLADRVTALRDGRYVATRMMSEVQTSDLIRMMVGRTLDELFPKQMVEPGEVLLEVEGLSLPGTFTDVSFQLRRGEILGMAGLVGAGRTNVARALFGIEPASSGRIRIAGREVRIESPQQAMALGIGYVPEDRKLHGLVLELGIDHNISLPILERFSPRGWINTRSETEAARHSAQQLEVKMASVAQPVGQLSGGNQQKVVLAKWLGTQPQILILDEPTRGIDVGTKAAVHALMSELAAQGMAILMISSELPEVLGMSDRIVVMREGRVAGIFEREGATQELLMAAATGAR